MNAFAATAVVLTLLLALLLIDRAARCRTLLARREDALEALTRLYERNRP